MAKENGNGGDPFKGMKTHNPPAEDSSRKAIGSLHPSVDTGAVRDGVAKTPTTLGPRTA